MIIPPKYRLTKEIASFLADLEGNRRIIDATEVPLKIQDNLRRESILGSALFSARIEGNRLTRAEISSFRDLTSKEKQKLEIGNLLRAITKVIISYKRNKKITSKNILAFHHQVMKNILSSEFTGRWRTGHEGIFDRAGNLVYHAPPPAEVPKLIEELIKYVNNQKEKLTPVKAILSHLVFEKIHPFVDGSGRMGRLLQLMVLTVNGYGMKGLVVVEEEIDKNRELYYEAIENSTSSDATEFVRLMLELLVKASGKTVEKLAASQKYKQEDLLPPRRRELLETIRDHRTVSLDFLHRRFLQIDPRMLRYDLKALIDEGFISKIGKTRGALYAVKN